MKLTISKTANPNYLAKIVEVTNFKKHPNADRLKLTTVGGYIIAVGIDTEPGIFIYFPIECCISQHFLQGNNLYRINTMNNDSEAAPGFFEENGRVKCLQLRGFASEGLLMPVTSLKTICPSFPPELSELIGCEFDTIDGNLLVRKYVIPKKNGTMPIQSTKSQKQYNNLIVENQFNAHPDTEQLKKNLFKFQSDTQIHISHKFHGTSAIFCNLLVHKKQSLWGRFLKLIGGNITTNEYKKFCSSRKVIKDPELNKGLMQSYYKYDIWNLALNVLEPYLQKGMSLYAELVGYLPNGGMIQNKYNYGCEFDKSKDYSIMSPQEMYAANLFKIYIYRITYTNIDGEVFEMSANNLQQYCRSKGLFSVIEDFYGTVFDFVETHCASSYLPETSGISYEEHFLNCLIERYLERNCGWCDTKVPAEGVVVRIDQPKFEAYKLKSLAFLTHESKSLDKGILDIEASETEEN